MSSRIASRRPASFGAALGVALYRLRHAAPAMTLAVGGAFLASLAAAVRHEYALEHAAAIGAFVAAAVAAIVLVGRTGHVATVLALVLTALPFEVAMRLVDRSLGWSGPAAWLIALPAALGVLALVARLRPLARYETRHAIVVGAPRETVWRTLVPSPDRPYWKPTMRIEAVAGKPGELRATITSGGASSRFRVEEERPGVAFTIVDLGDEDARGDDHGRQSYVLVERDGRTAIGVRFVLARPTLLALGVHALFDLPSDELRRLKAHLEGRADRSLGAGL